jgi:hypothetical protein
MSSTDSIRFDISRELGFKLIHGGVVVFLGKYHALLIHHQLPGALFERIAHLIWRDVRRDEEGYVWVCLGPQGTSISLSFTHVLCCELIVLHD